MVLDTNVLLSHLQFLVELKDFAIKGVGRPVLLIPWVVMQELDALKSSHRGSVHKRAQAAIAFLHNCFAARHPRVKGQTMEEVCEDTSDVDYSDNVYYSDDIDDNNDVDVSDNSSIVLLIVVLLI